MTRIRSIAYRMRLFVLGLSICTAATSAAEPITRATVDAWLNETPTVEPPPAGTVVTADTLATLKAWLPPGYYAELDFPEVTLEIQPTVHYPLADPYRRATEQFAGQATLGAGGELENYQAGRPFSDEQIAAASAAQAGLMVAWNQINRWQYLGYQIDRLTMTYIAAGSAGDSPDPAEGMDGGGAVERTLSQYFHRVYLSRVAALAEGNFRLDTPDSDSRHYKDYIELLSPFNVAGTAFVVERMLDPRADDQVNTYLPTERRVRRYSAKERADSFMGSDTTLDDFDGFAGRVLDYTWAYLGRRQVLDVADAGDEPLRFFGSRSRVPNSRWQLRDCHVVEIKSTWAEHPYKSRILLIDRETYDIRYTLIFNHDDQLWKVLDPIYRAARSASDLEHSVPSWRGQININLLGGTATVVRASSDTLHPTVTPSEVKRIFSVSRLTSGQ